MPLASALRADAMSMPNSMGGCEAASDTTDREKKPDNPMKNAAAPARTDTWLFVRRNRRVGTAVTGEKRVSGVSVQPLALIEKSPSEFELFWGSYGTSCTSAVLYLV